MQNHPYLEQLKSRGIIPGLYRLKAALSEINNPERTQKGAVIAGTNGKGSTSYTLYRLLCSHGYRTALYTSPHILDLNERYRIDDRTISDTELNNYIAHLRYLADKYNLTLFEFETLIAFQYFKDRKADFSIYEVGMGGRLDATNCFEPDLKIITNISKDHREFLGNTNVEILKEKAGIIKYKNTVVSGISQRNLIKTFSNICKKKNARLLLYNRDFFATNISFEEGFQTFDYIYGDTKLNNLKISFPARYQISNISVALSGFFALAEIYNFRIDIQKIRYTLKRLNFSGRFEIFSKSPLIIYDGAHNLDGIKKLIEALMIYNRNHRKIILIFSSLKNKQPEQKIKMLNNITGHIIFVPNLHPLSCTPEDYQNISKKLNLNKYEIMDIHSAITKACCDFSDHLILITGSLYMYRDIYDELKKRNI